MAAGWPLPDGAQAATRWPAPRERPSVYPGTTPGHPYLLVGDRVVPLVVDVGADAGAGGVAGSALRVTLADGTPLDDVLARLGAAPLDERVPVLAYGANRGPHSLALKFAHRPHGALAAAGPRGAPGPGVVPVLVAAVADHDVVAAGLSQQGFLRADLAPSPGTSVEAMIPLLDSDQVASIHDSEGVGTGRYDCVALPGGAEVAGTGRCLDVLAYACCRPVFVSPESGTPLAFAAIPANGRRFPALAHVDMLGHVLRTTGLSQPVAELCGLAPSSASSDVTVAQALSDLVNAQWWHEHRTGERPFGPAEQALALVQSALAAHGVGRPTAARLADAGAVLSPEEAYAAGPALRLAARPLRAKVGGAAARPRGEREG